LIKFSVLTSLYNSEKFLDNYFKTIFQQKLLPNEIVLVNDTKNPKNIIDIVDQKKKLYGFDEIYLINNKTNLGPAISLNKGIKFCEYNLIFRLDVDDLWSPNHTFEMIKAYKKNPSYLIYANSIKKNSFLTNLKCDDYLINENHLIHSSWLINRNICKNFRYHMLRPSIGLEDYFTLLYYSKKYKYFFIYLQTVSYINNIDSHGKISRKNKNFIKIRNKISKKFFFTKIKNNNFFEVLHFIFFKFGFIKFFIFLILYH